jgi:hypothetical protein
VADEQHRHADGSSRRYIDRAVADIDRVVNAQLPESESERRRVGLPVGRRIPAHHRGKGPLQPQGRQERARERRRFVAADAEPPPRLGQPHEYFGHAWKRTREPRQIGRINGGEAPKAGGQRRSAPGSADCREAAFHQPRQAMADQAFDCLERQRRKPFLGQHMV